MLKRNKTDDPIYFDMLLRRRFCKRLFLMLIVFGISFYTSVLLFGDLKIPRVMHLTDLNRCPACYGVSVCPELYSNQITLDSNWWPNVFNAKNIYHGHIKERKVILKKLAHDWEFKKFDAKICKEFNLKHNCRPLDLINTTVYDKIIQAVHYNFTSPDLQPRKGLIMCPYAESITAFLKPVLLKMRSTKSFKSDMVNIWTLLSINPEPLILQIIPKSKGWPVPAFGGVCGRLEVVANEGEPLASLKNVPYDRKLLIALRILEAAMDFTFKHDRFRFYLMDWSLDNIVVNNKNAVSFIDLEDIIVLDKNAIPKDTPKWYQRYSEVNEPDFSFSIQNVCKYHLSDHNLRAACLILAGPDDPFLYPMPKQFLKSIHNGLQECLNGGDRFKAVMLLQHFIGDHIQMRRDKNHRWSPTSRVDKKHGS